jgi:hypothetical protein
LTVTLVRHSPRSQFKIRVNSLLLGAFQGAGTCRGQRLTFPLMAFSQPHPGTSAVLVDELDADGFQGSPELLSVVASTGTLHIDKSLLVFPEPRRIRDRDHVRHVIKQPCLVCGRRPSDPLCAMACARSQSE